MDFNIYVSQPVPSQSRSNPCGSGGRTLKFLSVISSQFKLGGGDAIHTSGYEASHDASSVDEAYSFVVIFSAVNTIDDSPRRVIGT
jgi:hypothetical protein